jgi:hypothetical protein
MPLIIEDEIKTTGTAATDLTITCGTEKTLVLTTAVWEDLRAPATEVRLPASGYYNPAEVEYKGGIVLAFGDEASNEEEVSFLFQLPHSYKEGSDIYPHVHWVGEDNTSANVKWGLEYSWANVGVAFPTTTTIYVIDANADTDVHNMASFAAITGTGKTVSSMLICRLFRNSSSADDTYTGKSAYLLEFDLHYQIDTLGSRTETAK